MEIVKVPSVLPGCCFICNSINRDSFIDTEMSVDIDGPPFPGPIGAVYICNTCVHEFATMYGYLSPDANIELRKRNDELEELNYEAIKRIGALEESLSALANAGYKRIDDGRVVLNSDYLPETLESVSEESLGGTEELGIGEGETSESSDDEGVGELYSDESSSDSKFTLEL